MEDTLDDPIIYDYIKDSKCRHRVRVGVRNFSSKEVSYKNNFTYKKLRYTSVY